MGKKKHKQSLNKRNPSIKATHDGGLSKRWPVVRVKINMIYKERCMEMNQILRLLWDILAFPEGFHCIVIQGLTTS